MAGYSSGWGTFWGINREDGLELHIILMPDKACSNWKPHGLNMSVTYESSNYHVQWEQPH